MIRCVAFFLIAVFILAGCAASDTWPPNRADCVLGIHDGLGPCAPGTRGYDPQPDQQQQAMLAAAMQQHNEDVAACRAQFSESNHDAVARAKCFNQADEKFAPTARYPDLINLLMAKRSELAERQAAGKITRAQSMLELQQMITQLTSEEKRRDNDANAVLAQHQANNNIAAMTLLQSMQANRPAPYQLPMPTPPPPTLNTNCQTYGGNTFCQTR